MVSENEETSTSNCLKTFRFVYLCFLCLFICPLIRRRLQKPITTRYVLKSSVLASARDNLMFPMMLCDDNFKGDKVTIISYNQDRF